MVVAAAAAVPKKDSRRLLSLAFVILFCCSSAFCLPPRDIYEPSSPADVEGGGGDQLLHSFQSLAMVIEADLESGKERVKRQAGKRSRRLAGAPREHHRIVGGIDVVNKGLSKGEEKNPYPWYVLLKLRNEEGKRLLCGGSLISVYYVLTAAHCVKDLSTDEAESFTVDPEAGVRVHEHYDEDTLESDLALIRTDLPVRLVEGSVQTIGFPDPRNSFANQKATILGLGSTDEGGVPSRHLLQAEVVIWDNEDCERNYRKSNTGIEIKYSHMCASDSGKGSCKGDSGGPLNCYNNEYRQWELCGSVSGGDGCGRKEFPGVNVRGATGGRVRFHGKDSTTSCDFTNNDLSTHQVPDPAACGPLCSATRHCTHFVWTKGGTCRLKKGTVTQADALATDDKDMVCGVNSHAGKPGIIGAVVDWSAGGRDWTLGCDFPGNDLSRAGGMASAERCGPTCSATRRCTHFVWTPYDGGTCFLKTGSVTKHAALPNGNRSMVCGINANAGVDDGTAVNWNGNRWANACDFPGNDLGSVVVAAEMCGPTCAGTAGCTHYSWSRYNGGTCWMKKGKVRKEEAVANRVDSMVCGVN